MRRFFFAPKSLRAGGFWLPELAQEIAEATAFILLVGEKGIGPWQAMEYYEALDRRVKQLDFPVVLLLLEGQPAPGLPFLRQLHWVITPDATSEKSLTLVDGGSGRRRRAARGIVEAHRALSWPCRHDRSRRDYFFGRGGETAEVIGALAATPDKLPIVLGNSGVGKSSLAQAGVLAALMRQAWPETAEAAGRVAASVQREPPLVLSQLKPGTEPVRALVEPFLWTWQFDAVDPKRAELQSSWVSRLLDGKVTLRDLLDATEARYHDELHQPKPPAFLLYIDQGEELYVRAEERQRRRFSEIVARRSRRPAPARDDEHAGRLLRRLAEGRAALCRSSPDQRAAAARGTIARGREPAGPTALRTFRDRGACGRSSPGGRPRTRSRTRAPCRCCPTLLDDMWKRMVERGDGVLRLPAQSFELGSVLVDRADTFLAAHPNAEDSSAAFSP